MLRVLIIEDQPLQSERIKKSLEERGGEGLALEVSIAADAGAVTQALRRTCFHVITIDLSIPNRKGQLPGPEVGEDIIEQDYQPLAVKLIYSGENESHAGQRIAEHAVEMGFHRFKKSIVTDLCGYPPLVTTNDIAALISRGLSERAETTDGDDELSRVQLPSYRINYWQRATTLLPVPFCTAAQDLRTAALGHASAQTMQAADQFRQYVLRMAWAECAVMLRSAGVQVHPPTHHDDTLEPQLAAMRSWVESQRGIFKCFPLWRSCLRAGGGPQGQPMEYFDDSRRWRNALAHTKRLVQDWVPMFAEADAALLPLMDIASYWASCPLWFDVQLDRQASWSGRPVQGSALIPPRKRIADPPAVALRGDHVVQRIWRVDADTALTKRDQDNSQLPTPLWIDWYPYVRIETERGGTQLNPYVLSHARRGQPERFVYLNLFTGEEREIRVPMHEFRNSFVVS